MASMESDQGSMGEAKKELGTGTGEASQLASSAAEAVRARGREGLERVRNEAADRAEELANAIEATADDLESADGSETVSGYGRSMASMMRRLAGGLREQEIEEFAGQLVGYARRSPGSFLAGSVAIGFGISRFLKATSRPRTDESVDYQGDYSFDYEDEYAFEEEEDIDTTLEPSPSPEVSTPPAGAPWPQDAEAPDAEIRGGNQP